MGGGDGLTAAAGVGGTAIGISVALAAALRFVRWFSEFLAKRLDARADRLDRAEQAIERRMNKRLEHVEAELARYRLATMKLMGAFAEIAPGNPVLAEVAKILRETMPIVPPDGKLDGLIDKLGGTA